MRPACPECGSTRRIVEWNSVHVAYDVEDVSEYRQSRLLDFGSSEVAWDTADALGGPDVYQCKDCDHEFGDFDHQFLSPIEEAELAATRADEDTP